MSVISKRFADELNEKRMRDAYLSAQTRSKLSNQIRAVRTQRGWSQGEFATLLGKPQSNVSRLESRDYGNFTLKTLFALASAFDCGLVVEFVPYADFLRQTSDLSPSRLEVPSFTQASLSPLYQNGGAADFLTAITTSQDQLVDHVRRLLQDYVLSGTAIRKHPDAAARNVDIDLPIYALRTRRTSAVPQGVLQTSSVAAAPQQTLDYLGLSTMPEAAAPTVIPQDDLSLSSTGGAALAVISQQQMAVAGPVYETRL